MYTICNYIFYFETLDTDNKINSSFHKELSYIQQLKLIDTDGRVQCFKRISHMYKRLLMILAMVHIDHFCDDYVHLSLGHADVLIAALPLPPS